MGSQNIELVINSVRTEAKDILTFEMVSANGSQLPPFTPGAHLELSLPGGLIRHYSLYNNPVEQGRYCIGVGLAKESRGGSQYLHSGIKEGTHITSSLPRNHFPLDEQAVRYSFIAGGIGITPILSMIHWCETNGREWELLYLTRNRACTAFHETLREISESRVKFYFSEEHDSIFDIEGWMSDVRPESQVYCCGPGVLMERVQKAASSRSDITAHFEWFEAAPSNGLEQEPFKITFAASQITAVVPAGRSILDIAEEHNVMLPYACREGVCGTCETRVISGKVDHRDHCLSNEQKCTNETMIVCVSRAIGNTELVIDA